ncbi:YkvA family protein [Virgibacillus kimchii]
MRFLRRIRFLFKIHKSVPFLRDFFLTPEVKTATKVLYLAIIIGYFIFPFDLIPDFLVVIGLVDDVVIAMLILQQMIKIAPPSLKEKYNFSFK